MPFVFCICEKAVVEPGQLLPAGLWPATWDTPETATMLTTLEAFHNLSLQAQMNIHNFMESQALDRQRDVGGVGMPKGRAFEASNSGLGSSIEFKRPAGGAGTN
ncbi:hypothetical protein C8T65DRAFT_738477 [Cerioporus squamosus]|nr:hypothetical protein C8T65DRAFT_738477 [Cerioporus squamosus]